MTQTNIPPYNALADAQARTEAREVELPGFGDGKPWTARLKRLSLLGLARGGKIPNELLGAVTELYQHGTVRNPDLRLAAETMYLIAGEALAEPTLAELEAAGVPLTDEQLAAIYLYAQRGVEALRPFRKERAVGANGADGAAVRDAAQPANGCP